MNTDIEEEKEEEKEEEDGSLGGFFQAGITIIFVVVCLP